MRIISKDELYTRKTSDTIFVLGSGWSVNRLSDFDWSIVKSHNSIGFNWFCKHKFEPTFFLLREQSNIPSRSSKDESVENFIRLINNYKTTTGIICDVSKHSKRAYKYQNDDRIKIDCVIVRDIKPKTKRAISHMSKDIFDYGIIHHDCTMYNVMHFIKYMQYKKIVFIGVDLYDSRYFWLPLNQTRHTVIKKGQKYNSKHAISRRVLRLVSRFKKRFSDVEMFVANRKSELRKIIPVKSILEFKCE